MKTIFAATIHSNIQKSKSIFSQSTQKRKRQTGCRKNQDRIRVIESILRRPDRSEEERQKASDQLAKAADEYKGYVKEQSDQLVKATEAFTGAVKSGDIEKSKTLYAKARVYYERIEPIAESLGDLDPKIDARETMLKKETNGQASISLRRPFGRIKIFPGKRQQLTSFSRM